MSLDDDMRNAEDATLRAAERHFDVTYATVERFDTNDTLFMTCPYCGHRDLDGDEVRPDRGVHECPECGEEYNYERSENVTYDTWEV